MRLLSLQGTATTTTSHLCLYSKRLYSSGSNIAEQLSKFLKESSSVPTSKGERLFRLGGLAASVGFGAASQLFKRKGGGDGAVNTKFSSLLFTPDNVEKIVATLTRMRGAALKLGQMISMQEDAIFPPEVERIFARVRDGANFMPVWQMNAVMKNELGEEWRSKFIEFDDIPIAAASIGQVHRAKLSTGKLVAVKIQYPGIAKSIISDLENLKAILVFSRLLPKGLFLENSIKVAQRELAWECDYRREAFYQQKFFDFATSNPANGFSVPKVYPELSTEKVLTADYISGTLVNKLTEISQEERNLLATRIVWLCLQEIFSWQCMQTDPNWSNFLRDDQSGELVLLDFGATRDFSPQFTNNYAKLIQAASIQDQDAVLKHSIELGFLTGDETNDMINAHVNAVLALGLPFVKAGIYDFSKASQDITSRVKNLIPTMLSHRLTPPPEESYSLHRKLSGVFLLCTRLGAKIDCHQLLSNAMTLLKNK